MKIVLWMLQVLLAVAYLAHGWFFLFPPAEMIPMLNESIPQSLRLVIGVAEVLAACGLILPGVTGIFPWLVAWAAAGLMIVMASATVLHISRSETSSALSAAVLLIVVTFVAYMRWKVMPIPPRVVAPYPVGVSQ